MCPVKVTAWSTFMIAAAVCPYQAWASSRPACTSMEEVGCRWSSWQHPVCFLAASLSVLLRVWVGVALSTASRRSQITPAPDTRRIFRFVITMFLAFGVHLFESRSYW